MAPAINPKILDTWQSDSSFSLASWEKSGHEQPPEWDTSQDSSSHDSSQGDADRVELTHTKHENSPLDQSSDAQPPEFRSRLPPATVTA